MRRLQQWTVAAGALAFVGALAASRIPAPVALGSYLWPAAAGFAALLALLQHQGFVFHWRGESTKISLDELGILLAVLVLPPTLVVVAVAAASLVNQAVHRREPLKGAFNVAQYTLAATAAVAAATALRFAGIAAPWFALPAPVIFSALTALLVSLLFARLEQAPILKVYTQRFGRFVLIAAALGTSLGFVVYALFRVHPLAVVAAVPIFVYLRRFGRLSEWADDEITTHRLVAGVSMEVAGRADLDAVAQRILTTCQELFDCGEASLTFSMDASHAPRAWQRQFGESAGYGGVSAEVLGPAGTRVGSLSVFPKPGQARYGEREHQLLRTVAAAATAAAANAHALRVASEANAALSASEERYRSLFDTAHVLIHVLDERGRVVDANPAAREALAWAGDAALVERLVMEGEVVGLETRLQDKEGRALDVLLDARVLAGAGAPRFVVFARDISTIKALEQELRRSMAKQNETIKRLENMNRELEEFTLWTTHDMREPLRSIGTIADFLHEDIGTISQAEARDMARRICEGADRLKERVKALHAFSLIVQRDDEFQDVPMQRVIEGVVTALEAKVREKRATIVLPRTPFPIVRAQPHRIDQVFGNLVENALKYGRCEEPRVEIGVVDAKAEWRFYVRDNGPGIPVGYHERVFQLFQRGPDPQEGGSGAGLAIVKRIAEQHGGRAWVESREGDGACFYVAIPKAAPLDAQAPMASLRKPF